MNKHIFWFVAILSLLSGCTVRHYDTNNYSQPDGGTEAENPIMYQNTDGEFGAKKQQSSQSVAGSLKNCNTDLQQGMQFVFPEAQTYTIQFSRIANVNAQYPTVTEALIKWKTAGNTITRKVLVSDGVSISGTAEAVEVIIYDNTPNQFPGPFPNPDDGLEYKVSASVAPGVRAVSSVPPTYPGRVVSGGVEVVNFSVPAGTTQVVEIPQDIGVQAVRVNAAVPGNSPINAGDVVILLQTTTTETDNWDVLQNDWQPTNGATEVAIKVNAGIGHAVFFTVLFAIDG